MASFSEPEKLSRPPFPELTWDEFFWVASDSLPDWAGFQDRGGAYCSESSDDASDGLVSLNVLTENDEPTELTPAQIAAYKYLKANGRAIADAVIGRIVQEYPAIRKNFMDEAGQFPDGFMPIVEKPEDLKSLIGLGNVHFPPVGKDGVGYIGFELGCTWEQEHGLGVLTHKTRVVDFGFADVAFSWPDEDDA